MVDWKFHESTGYQDPRCIDLVGTFGEVYKTGFDPAYDSYHVPRDKWDCWMMTLLCERAIVYPYGQDVLAAEVDGRRSKTWRELDALGLHLHQCGSSERTYLFDIHQWPDVAPILRPRKRHRISQERREAARQRMTAWNQSQSQCQGGLEGAQTHPDAAR
jgi:hypothetical protein